VCNQTASSYEDAVQTGKVCTDHADCSTAVVGSLLCGCKAVVSGNLEAIEAAKASFDAQGCSAPLTCPECPGKPGDQVGVCIEEICHAVHEVECDTLIAIQHEIVAGFAVQTSTLECEENADCQQCFGWSEDFDYFNIGWTHVDVDTSFLSTLSNGVTAKCCCSGDDGGAPPPELGPCCIDGKCTTTSSCTADCPEFDWQTGGG
jgi:hypothetical protein